MTDEPITLTLAQAAKLLGVSTWLARRLARENRFPGAFRIGGAIRVHKATLEHEIERLAAGKPPSQTDADEVLARALGDVTVRLARHRSSRGAES